MHVDLPLDMDGASGERSPGKRPTARSCSDPASGRISGGSSVSTRTSASSTLTDDELHDLLWNLPLFRFMTIQVTPLAAHPSDISAGPSASVIQLHRRTLALAVHAGSQQRPTVLGPSDQPSALKAAPIRCRRQHRRPGHGRPGPGCGLRDLRSGRTGRRGARRRGAGGRAHDTQLDPQALSEQDVLS